MDLNNGIISTNKSHAAADNTVGREVIVMNNKINVLWENFYASGSIYDYIKYSEALKRNCLNGIDNYDSEYQRACTKASEHR